MTEEAGTDFHIWGPCNSWQSCCTVLRERLRSGSHIPALAGQDIPLHGIHILHVPCSGRPCGWSATGQVSGDAVMATLGSHRTESEREPAGRDTAGRSRVEAE